MAAPPPSMKFDSTFGATMISGYINAVLYGILCLQCYIFFNRFQKEGRLLKYSVWALWVLNTIHFIFIVHLSYWYMVTNFANIDALTQPQQPWSVAGSVMATTFTNLLVQGWFVFRVWILSSKSVLLTAIMVLGVLGAWGFGLAFSIELIISPSFASHTAVNWIFDCELALASISDLGIALALCYFLWRIRTYSIRRTTPIVNVILVYVVNTGLVTSFLSVACLITRSKEPVTLYFWAIYMILGSLYSNAFAGSLNARDWFRSEDGQAVTLSAPSSAREERVPSNAFRLVAVRGKHSNTDMPTAMSRESLATKQKESV